MLNTEDKKWLSELFDKRFTEQDRTLAQMRKESRNQFDLMMEAMDKHAEELRKETDVRFSAMSGTCNLL